MAELTGKTALITGAARGIGRSTAFELGELGANVVVNYQQSKEAAEELCGQLTKKGVKCVAIKADVSREELAEKLVKEATEAFGAIDILVNNAGITRDRSFLKMSREIWDEVLGVNLTGPFNITHAVLPGMVQAGWGRVINMASVVGQTGNFGQANYAATKGGIIAFTMTLAREVARKGITVNAVAPGYIETDMTKDVPDSVKEHVASITPLGRMGKPEEVAAVVGFVASPKSSYLTGQVIPVNGGMYM